MRATAVPNAGPWPVAGLPPGAPSPYLAAALKIAGDLVRDAVEASPGLTWRGDDLCTDGADALSIVRGPVGHDLYGGTAGIALFLSHVARWDGSGACAGVAERAIGAALASASARLNAGTCGLYSGATGVALAALDVAEHIGSTRVRRAALRLAARVAATVREQLEIVEVDLVSGLAGITIGLLAIRDRTARWSGRPALLETSHAAAEQLTRAAARSCAGWSWPDAGGTDGAPGLCGLAHGASGVGWALAEAGWATGEPSFLAAAQEAFRYERSWFSAERCAWPDLREHGEAATSTGEWPGWTTAWCHGALGIGAVRLRIYEALRNTDALAEASAAIQAVRTLVVGAGIASRDGAVCDPTPCHGLGGAADLLVVAHEVLGSDDHLRAARRVGDLCLDALGANGGTWPCGLHGAREVPGLFLGLAGVGEMMLRLHDPTSVGALVLPGRRPMAAGRGGRARAGTRTPARRWLGG